MQRIACGAWKAASVGAIAGVIAMIPLGPVLLSSVAFAVGALRLARHGVLMQELAAAEGLVRVDVLCLDKTGTLTVGRMVFDAAHAAGSGTFPGWELALAWFGADPEANATAACMRPAYGMGSTDGPAGSRYLGPRSAGRDPGDCLTTASMGRAAAHASAGLRTLVLPYAPRPPGTGLGGATPALAPVVLLSFREELRPDARQILDYFAREGVSLRVLSGDDPRTVVRVAREAGMNVDSGFDASVLPEDPLELEVVMESNTVFGRVAPSQKGTW